MAKKWLKGTFFYIRLKKDPSSCQIKGLDLGLDADLALERLCEHGLSLLTATSLITPGLKFTSTEFGHAMSRYFVQYDTMKIFRSIPPKAKVAEIVCGDLYVSQLTLF